MNTYIALLRGINVSGQKKIKMVDLKALFESLGFQEVCTYIQSGNVVFVSEEGNLTSKIQKGILDTYGWEVPVLVKTALEIKGILDNCPFAEEKKAKSYFILLQSPPDILVVEEIQKRSTPEEEFTITPNCVYIHYAVGAGKAKLGNNWFEKKLGVSATSRNYRTLTKVLELAGA